MDFASLGIGVPGIIFNKLYSINSNGQNDRQQPWRMIRKHKGLNGRVISLDQTGTCPLCIHASVGVLVQIFPFVFRSSVQLLQPTPSSLHTRMANSVRGSLPQGAQDVPSVSLNFKSITLTPFCSRVVKTLNSWTCVRVPLGARLFSVSHPSALQLGNRRPWYVSACI